MDRAPQPGIPEEPESEVEAQYKKRLLKRLRGLMGRQEEPQELDLGGGVEQEDAPDELWSRESEVEEEAGETVVPRIQQLGRSVLEQTRAVHGFAESLGETVDELPQESRDAVKPEADRLSEATHDLKESAEELNEELEGLEEAVKERPEDAEPAAAAPVEAPEVAESAPKKDRSEAMGMARLVIATLIGGGLGALVGGEARKKEKAASREKTKMSATIEKQKATLAAQEAELQKLKADKPEAAPEKEYVEKAVELAERQTDLAQSTIEQVRVAAKMASESETTFRIPERRAEQTAAVAVEKEYVEGAERLQEKSVEGREDHDREHAIKDVAEVSVGSAVKVGEKQPEIVHHTEPIQPDKLYSQTWIYWALLAIAAAVALGLILFGSR